MKIIYRSREKPTIELHTKSGKLWHPTREWQDWKFWYAIMIWRISRKISEITKDEARDFWAVMIISANHSMLSHFSLLEILVAEVVPRKVCSDFYEKYGISSADTNMVQIVFKIYGCSLQPTCGVFPLQFMIYAK